MAVSDQTLERARKLNRQAAEAVLTDAYGAVWRIAHGVIGKPGPAQKVVDAVFSRSLHVMPTWRPGLTPASWFQHHTLLNARLVADPPPAVQQDLLVTTAAEQSPEYLGFIRALRHLPIQQREAFILRHGENMDERQLGVAMDSSTTAATNHLRAATDSLDKVTGGRAVELAKQLSAAYTKLEPTDKAIVPYVRRKIGRAIWWRRIRRFIRRVFILAILGGLAYAGWRYRDQLIEWYHSMHDSPTTQP